MPRKELLQKRPRKKPGVNTIRGNTKRCNCPLHNGEYVPLDQFWYFKSGRMAGKPMARCIAGTRIQQGKDPGKTGFVPLTRFKFVFRELESRIGRMETCRRAGISINFWMRMDRGIVTQARKQTMISLISVLREARAHDEVRHKDSIRHGASARGRKERKVEKKSDLNLPSGDDDAAIKRKYRAQNEDYNKRQSDDRLRRYHTSKTKSGIV